MIVLVSNNFYNGEVIVSYDSSKIWEKENDGQRLFCKQTSLDEVKNIKKMNKLLQNASININNHKYDLKIPKIYDWDSNKKIISMEFCLGKNLEFYLRNRETYNEGQLILNELLQFLIENKIYWLDFAARNIIIGENEIYLVDYEKGFARKNTKIKDFFRNHVYEEYCIFLFLKDRRYNFEEILDLKNEKNDMIDISKIKCIRSSKLAELLGYKKNITKKEYLNILKMLIDVQEPKIVENKFYFPCVDFDKIFSNKKKETALEEYCKKVIHLYSEKNKNKLTSGR